MRSDGIRPGPAIDTSLGDREAIGPWRPTGPLVTGAFGLAARLLGQTSPKVRKALFQLGCSIKIYIGYPSERWDAFFFHLTPSDARHTWVFYETLRTRAPLFLFDPVQRSFMARVLDDGERELTLVVRDQPSDLPPTSVESDRFGLAARQFYLRCLEHDEGRPESTRGQWR